MADAILLVYVDAF